MPLSESGRIRIEFGSGNDESQSSNISQKCDSDSNRTWRHHGVRPGGLVPVALALPLLVLVQLVDALEGGVLVSPPLLVALWRLALGGRRQLGRVVVLDRVGHDAVLDVLIGDLLHLLVILILVFIVVILHEFSVTSWNKDIKIINFIFKCFRCNLRRQMRSK